MPAADEEEGVAAATAAAASEIAESEYFTWGAFCTVVCAWRVK